MLLLLIALCYGRLQVVGVRRRLMGFLQPQGGIVAFVGTFAGSKFCNVNSCLPPTRSHACSPRDLYTTEEGRTMNIYVGNLDFKVTEDDLRQAFSAYGQ